MKNQFELILGKLLSEEKFNEDLVANLDEALKKNNFVLSVSDKSLLKEILKSGFEVNVGNERIILMCGSCCAAGGPCDQ